MAAASQIQAGAAHAVPTHKWLIALAVMLGTTLEVLDSSIVNVALPHMQGSFSASVDEITWVLTSYLVANGIMIPMTGWISARVRPQALLSRSRLRPSCWLRRCAARRGRSIRWCCFRLLQGVAGAAMIPSRRPS